MKKLAYLVLIVLLIVTVNTEGQTLINGVSLTSIDLEINGQTVDSKNDHHRMVLPNTPLKIKVYQDDKLTYWAEFNYKQCGKNAKLTSKTYVELNDGSTQDGVSHIQKYKINGDQSGWFVGYITDVFEIKEGNDIAMKATFGYDMRYN